MQEIKKGWKKVKLGEIADIIMGQSPKSEFYTENSDDIPFFQGCTEFQELYPIVSKYCSKPTKLAKEGDILMSVRAPVGALNLSNIDCCIGRGLCSINSKNHKNNWFLLYLLKGNLDYLKTQGGGSVYDSINKDTLSNLELLIPENIQVQQKIASILSKYDDLIENNNKRIKILEETAQSIYEEWFVKYNFPGSENIKMVDSGNDDFGMIPEGWEVGLLKDIIKIKKNKYTDDMGKLPLLDLARIPRKSFNINDYGSFDELTTSRILFDKYDILFGSIRPYFHKVVFAGLQGITNVSVFVLKPIESFLFSYVLLLLFSDKTVSFATVASGGTKMPVIKWEVLKNMNILIPNKNILKEFNNLLINLFDEILNLQKQNQNLKETRDLLIPRLVSGELDVENLDVK